MENGRTYRLNDNHRWERVESTQVAPSTPGVHHTETPEFKAWFGDSKVVDADGKPKVVFHGAKRADRVGNRFRKDRATSGPMQYFTDDPELASNYSTEKRDTSAERPTDYAQWFKWTPPGQRRAVDIDKAWVYLPYEERDRIKNALYTVGYSDYEEASGPIVAGTQSIMNRASIDWELREAKGNALRAAVEMWLSSGTLFNKESRFLEVLGALGVKGADIDDPDESRSGVFPVYLDIRNPLDTANIPEEVYKALEQASKRKRSKKATGGDPDAWDKNTIDGRSWYAYLLNDRQAGLTHAWTRVPDWVTETLEGMGYDGLKDIGGKHGGKPHTVWVPFREDQIKSKANRGTWDRSTGNMLMSLRPGMTKVEDGKTYRLNEHHRWESVEEYPHGSGLSRAQVVKHFTQVQQNAGAGGYVEKHINDTNGRIWEKISKSPWKTINDLQVKGRGGVSLGRMVRDSVTEMKRAGFLTIAWDRDGNSHYAVPGAELPPWLTQSDDDADLAKLPPKPTGNISMALRMSGLSGRAITELGNPDASTVANPQFEAARWIREEARNTLKFWDEFREFRDKDLAREYRKMLGPKVQRLSLYDPDDEDDEEEEEEDDSEVMSRAEMIAEFLTELYGEDAEKMFDELFSGAITMAVRWDPFQHPRDKAGRFIEKNSPEAVTAARKRIEDSLTEPNNDKAFMALVDHLAILTTKQLATLKLDYDIRASAKSKEDLISKIASRLARGRRNPRKMILEEGNKQLREIIERHAGAEVAKSLADYGASILHPDMGLRRLDKSVQKSIMTDLQAWFAGQGLEIPEAFIPKDDNDWMQEESKRYDAKVKRAKAAYAQAREYGKHPPPLAFRSLEVHHAILHLETIKELEATQKTLSKLEIALYAMLDHPQLAQEARTFENLWNRHKNSLLKTLLRHQVGWLPDTPPSEPWDVKHFILEGLGGVADNLERQYEDMQDGSAVFVPSNRNIPNGSKQRDKWYAALKEHVLAGNSLTEDQLEAVRHEDWLPPTQKFRMAVNDTKNQYRKYMEKDFAVHRHFVRRAIADSAPKIEAMMSDAESRTKPIEDEHAKASEAYMKLVWQTHEDLKTAASIMQRRSLTAEETAAFDENVRIAEEARERVTELAKAQRAAFLGAFFAAPKSRTLFIPLPTEWVDREAGSWTDDPPSREQKIQFEAAEEFLNLITEGRLSFQVPTYWTTEARSYEKFGKIHLHTKAIAPTIIHEVGHAIESQNGGRLAALSKAFAMDSIEAHGETPEHLGYNYLANEIGAKNGFMDTYTGKFYDSYASEVLSMGVQQLYINPLYFARTSPEHFKYTIAALKGLIA